MPGQMWKQMRGCAIALAFVASVLVNEDAYGATTVLSPVHVVKASGLLSMQQWPPACAAQPGDRPSITDVAIYGVVVAGQDFEVEGGNAVILGETVSIVASGEDIDELMEYVDGVGCVSAGPSSPGPLQYFQFKITPPAGGDVTIPRPCTMPAFSCSATYTPTMVGTHSVQVRCSDQLTPWDCNPETGDTECFGPWSCGGSFVVVAPSTGEWTPSPVPGSPDGDPGITTPAGPGVVVGIDGGTSGAWIDPETGTLRGAEGSGTVKVLVTRPSRGGDDPNEHHLVPVKVGECQPCEGDQCEIGSGQAELGCVQFTISLGKDVDGFPIGDLVISSLTADSGRVGTPRVLYFLGEDGEKIVNGNGLRQVLAPSCTPTILVDVNTIGDPWPENSTPEYTIDIYSLDSTPPLVPDSDLYDVAGLDLRASWYVTYTGNLEIYRGSDSVFDRRYVYEDQGRVGSVGDPDFFHQMTLHTFLPSGTGGGWEEFFEDRLSWYQPSGEQPYWQRVVTHTDWALSGSQYFRQSVELHEVVSTQYGQVNTRVRARREEVQGAYSSDTDLTTYYGYYPGYGALKYVLYPDGSWVWYNRDEDNRVTEKITPWKDVSIGSGESVTAPLAASNVVVEYSYESLDAQDTPGCGDTRPRTITKKILGNVVSKTFYAYWYGEMFEVVEQALSPSSTYQNNTLRTETSYVTGNAERIAAVKYPDGRWDQYSYTTGTYYPSTPPVGPAGQPGQFVPHVGGRYLKTVVTHGYGTTTFTTLEGKSTQDLTIKDPAGHVVLEEEYAYWTSPSTVSARVGWTVRDYDTAGHLIHVYKSDGSQEDYVFDCCHIQEYSGVEGREITYEYLHELSDLVVTLTRTGVSFMPEVTETYTHDAFGHVKVATRTGAIDTESESLSSTRSYDKYGRLEYEIDEAGLTTTYAYGFTAEGGREVTINYPNGTTKITAYHRDGRVRSVTGTAVVGESYGYGAGPGTQQTLVHSGSVLSPRWKRTNYDMLGRLQSEHRPTPEAGINAETHYYYGSGGELSRVQGSQYDLLGSSLDAATLYVYDELGNRIQTCVDVNRNSAVDLAGTDRITEVETKYVEDGGVWWMETVNRTYPTTGSGTPIITGTHRRQLTGLGTTASGSCAGDYTIVGVSKSFDINGNETTTTRKINRIMRCVEETTDGVSSVAGATKIFENGFLTFHSTEHNIWTSYTYDPLERLRMVSDSTNSTVTLYDSDGRTERVIKADMTDDVSVTLYAYYPDATSSGVNVGRLKSTEQLPGNKKTYYEYNARGQITHVWGHTPQPVEIGYDSYGQRTSLTTYQGGTSWTGTSWPTGEIGNTTQWAYQESTGLLLSKTYADTSAVTYEYSPKGQLIERLWARPGIKGHPVAATYGYDDDTGELTSISYGGFAPNVSFTYDRLGRMATATDALGTHTFSYDPTSLQLAYEDISGPLYDRRITRLYDDGLSGGVAGRPIGLTVGSASDPDADYATGYDYDAYGRLERVTGPGLPAGGAKYSFVSSPGSWNSNLVSQVEYVDATDVVQGRVIRTYEDNRDLLASVENKWDMSGTMTTISKYAYVNDALGRRTSVVTTGTAFGYTGGDAHNVWAYNDRNELMGSTRREGTTIGSGTEMVPQRRAYDYDPIGNRTEYTIADAANPTTYTTNSVNQYTATATPAESFVYDADGNMTQDGVYTYTYDAENRLIRVAPTTPATGDLKVESLYDYMGRRVRKAVTAWDASLGTSGAYESTPESVTYFVYDGWNVIMELDGQGWDDPATDVEDTAIRKYTWGLDLSGLLGNPSVSGIHGAGGIGGLLAAEQLAGSRQFVYFYDGNGNVGQVYNHTFGSTAAMYEYDPYGNLTSRLGTVFNNRNPFRFSTKYFDKELDLHGVNDGLYYYGYRFYSPRLGRWVNRDPLEERGGKLLRRASGSSRPTFVPRDNIAAQMHLYRFTRNSPSILVDPLGLKSSQGSICRCGPDITEALEMTLHEINHLFKKLDPAKRETLCDGLFAIFDPPGMKWEIKSLFQDAPKLKTANCPKGKPCEVDRRGPGIEGGASVTVNGKCYASFDVNYALWGRMASLCDKEWKADLTRGCYKLYNGHSADRIYGATLWTYWGKYFPKPSSMPLESPPRLKPCQACPDKWKQPFLWWAHDGRGFGIGRNKQSPPAFL